jgi:hypothetical protein
LDYIDSRTACPTVLPSCLNTVLTGRLSVCPISDFVVNRLRGNDFGGSALWVHPPIISHLVNETVVPINL